MISACVASNGGHLAGALELATGCPVVEDGGSVHVYETIPIG